MKYLQILLLLFCVSPAHAQFGEDETSRELSRVLLGRWELKKNVYEGQVWLDISDQPAMLRDSLKARAEKGIALSARDSAGLVAGIEQFADSMKKNYYLDFGPESSITAGVYHRYPQARSYKLTGIYETDYGKLRIELVDNKQDMPGVGGTFHWYIRNGELFLYRYLLGEDVYDVYTRPEKQ